MIWYLTLKFILNEVNVILSDATFTVSHRVSSAKKADKIIVLNEGEIIQKGTHDDLIHIDGYYKSLYEQQLLEKKINL